MSVRGNDVSRRSESIAVHDACCVSAVGQDDSRRSIPWLGVKRVETVKGSQVRFHGIDVLPSRRNKDLHSPEDVHAPTDKEVEHVIQACRIGRFEIDQWQQFVNILVQRIRKLVTSGNRPVAIALDGVDFAVVRQHSKRLC